MKRLHLYIIKRFIGPLIVTLLISLFVLLMQFLWVYLDDLVGKGLEMNIIVEFLVYTLAMLMPMALPLSMLLASIMTFGDMGENNELLAMKAAGISLFRIMKPVIVVSILLSFGAFQFSNRVIPVSYKKLITLMASIRQMRPEIVIKEGVFSNDIDNFSIKVGRKAKDGSMLYDIMIYDHRYDQGNETVTVADSGTMKITTDKRYMILNLYSGETHAEVQTTNRESTGYPVRTDKFKKETIYSKLQGMDFERKDESIFKSANRSLNNKQLRYVSDSLSKQFDIFATEQALSIAYPLPVATAISSLARNDPTYKPDYRLKKYVDIDSVLRSVIAPVRNQMIEGALSNARNNIRALKQVEELNVANIRSINRFDTEWHKKYTYSIACLIFFFIGAPLGAIIRKGGLGMPLVVSVVLFIFYWILSTTGEKYVREATFGLWFGIWFSTFIFLPAGIFLTYKAVTDSTVLNIDSYLEFLKKIRFRKKSGPDQQE
ncbi:MAG: LptF/LptG family permease [Prolixibacteraceae bacterium]|jgi:lipopolysaccharide export system permease protein|nr:LptF/LptG family permease [Prolixibacteraceae bacterium]